MKKSSVRQGIIKQIKEMRNTLVCLEMSARTGDPKKMAMVATFFHVLNHHLEDGDLTPENIDLVLHLKHNELLNERK